ncbi:Selenocysteine-specific elongation factor [Monoraphidium neglectum]|uniref:Selenocysteine-specific elongation factor n=1 Tax=Monoraphidium neglectum TaxID=145388 RepID=A0A0D2KBT0_9CHLO|nr:Selenocysteine-specific elongation factor [Monoraphidium neglectum]KIZ07588.1 Selenocysteine-specific elongation factor [Monoraphidium neglectum]|eukprot:XP_013906607.1 Selenocysteine-specific elongation factor [Monoraphidium neglectum]
MAEPREHRVLNINVGVLGHVDSGKTSLVAALSSTLSTAALDKHPQSRERGITLDLGFSAFAAPLPRHLAHLPYNELQFTLVDCPGHASLIRTIIGGARIIDMMVLVVDITKGLQAQTAECLVVGEMAAQHLVVALNKTDLIPEQDRPKAIKKAQKRLGAAFASTRFAGAPMVPVCARPGACAGADGAAAGGAAAGAEGIEELKGALLGMAAPRAAAAGAPLLFAVDHCFAIRGQGTVLTGTVLQGGVSVNDTIELPALKISRQARRRYAPARTGDQLRAALQPLRGQWTRRQGACCGQLAVKSIQMFRRPARAAAQGDRAALLVTQLDPKLMERGLAAAPGSVPAFCGAVATVEKVRFFDGPVPGKVKYHVNVGHETVMAEATFFGLPDGGGGTQEDALQQMISSLEAMSLHLPPAEAFDWEQEYAWQDQLYGLEGRPHIQGQNDQQLLQAAAAEGPPADAAVHFGPQWALLKFDQPLTAPSDSAVIGARLDLDSQGGSCRLAFYGRIVSPLDTGDPSQLARLQVFKPKERCGTIERIAPDGSHAICRGLFKKETDVGPFMGAAVTTARGEAGAVEGRFGTSGKVRLDFSAAPLAPAGERAARDNAVALRYKKFVFAAKDGRRRIRQ